MSRLKGPSSSLKRDVDPIPFPRKNVPPRDVLHNDLVGEQSERRRTCPLVRAELRGSGQDFGGRCQPSHFCALQSQFLLHGDRVMRKSSYIASTGQSRGVMALPLLKEHVIGRPQCLASPSADSKVPGELWGDRVRGSTTTLKTCNLHASLHFMLFVSKASLTTGRTKLRNSLV